MIFFFKAFKGCIKGKKNKEVFMLGEDVDINWSWIEIKVFGSSLFFSSYFISRIKISFHTRRDKTNTVRQKPKLVITHLTALSEFKSPGLYKLYHQPVSCSNNESWNAMDTFWTVMENERSLSGLERTDHFPNFSREGREKILSTKGW